jgi:hypothetical protein
MCYDLCFTTDVHLGGMLLTGKGAIGECGGVKRICGGTSVLSRGAQAGARRMAATVDCCPGVCGEYMCDVLYKSPLTHD